MSGVISKTCLLSVVCPVYNEVDHIEALLRFFIQAKPDDKELFLIDGGSTDGTLEIIANWQKQHDNIYLLHNERQYVPFALNKAIPQCRGKYIVRLDAHTEYKENYFEEILKAFEKSGADIVGGPTRKKSSGKTSQAIAYAISTPLGIGDSRVHQEDYEGFTDSVTFGAWRRSVFDRIGLFDERLKRNQDDEFHYRAKSKGLTIYQSPAIHLYYYPRSTLVTLFHQYYQYGFYKPLVLKKVPSGTKMRHVIPSLFLLYLIACPVLAVWSFLFLFPLVLYVLLVIYYSFRSDLKWREKFHALLVYPTLHIAYGAGFLLGLSQLWKK